jgi:hypothetical protein
MASIIDWLRARRAERRRKRAERALQEHRHGVPRRGSGAPRGRSESESVFKGGGTGGG